MGLGLGLGLDLGLDLGFGLGFGLGLEAESEKMFAVVGMDVAAWLAVGSSSAVIAQVATASYPSFEAAAVDHSDCVAVIGEIEVEIAVAVADAAHCLDIPKAVTHCSCC